MALNSYRFQIDFAVESEVDGVDEIVDTIRAAVGEHADVIAVQEVRQ